MNPFKNINQIDEIEFKREDDSIEEKSRHEEEIVQEVELLEEMDRLNSFDSSGRGVFQS